MNELVQSISLEKVASLSSKDLQVWAALQTQNPVLSSPFFRPEFAQLVALEIPGVHVIVVRSGDSPIAFLPIQKTDRCIAAPVGGVLCDYQGIVAAPDFRFDAQALIRCAGLHTWDFDHLLADQDPFVPFHFACSESPHMDVRGSFSEYLARRPSNTSRRIHRILMRHGQAEREYGPVRFCVDDRSPGTFERMIRWKRAQFVRTGAEDIFAMSSTRKIYESIHACVDEAFRGIVSTLYIGDKLAAGWYGIRSYGVHHLCVGSYDPEFQKYSPGLLTLIRLAQQAAQQGIDYIDLGKGNEPYKQWFYTGATAIAEGFVECRPLVRFIRRPSLRLKNYVVGSSLHRPSQWLARNAARFVPGLKHYLHMRPRQSSSDD